MTGPEVSDPEKDTPLDPKGPYADKQDTEFGRAAKDKEEQLDESLAAGDGVPSE